MRNVLSRGDWQVALLDIEASAIAKGSYPIEVGFALVEGDRRQILSWSTLIQPAPSWSTVGVWSPASARIHGLSLPDLEQQGRPVGEVCDWLNSALGRRTVVATDAPRYDQDWLDTLFGTAGREQQFTLYELSMLTRDFTADQHRQFAYLLRREPTLHRAGADALRMARALMETHLGYPPVVREQCASFAPDPNRLS